MKMIEAIVKPAMLEEIQSALGEIGIEDFMESTITCHGRQPGPAMVYRGDEYVSCFVEKVKLEVIAADESVANVIEAIAHIAKTERREDCRIFILPFLEAH